jgi:rubrerythrin
MIFGALVGAAFGHPLLGLLGAATLTREQRGRIENTRRELKSLYITCSSCQGGYHLSSKVKKFNCPVCRLPLELR